ncbi:protein FAR1-RELATED SEQUENCE 5-like [Vicia villosa]|uniref:protein FAR1-RELATED SEQUENCE 5-like n=1 Tax=Vicia villosa TaxID=3911 RepID=UPI00273B1919|nr:protein FAR1-RELATED SEQUENCE 5-like [Vicia villosa]
MNSLSENLNVSKIPIVEDVEKKCVKNIQHEEHRVVDYTYTPHLDMEFESEAAAYEFYNEYSRVTGFGIRREYGNKSRKDGTLTSRRFTCFKEGMQNVDKRRNLIKEGREGRVETRTGCDARMVISLDRKIGKYKVVDFVGQHNHALLPPGYVNMVRSHRRISESQTSHILVGEKKSRLKQKVFRKEVSNEVDGMDGIGCTRQESKNYLPTRRMRSLMYGEVGALLMHFKRQSENPSFFYDFQLDVEQQITNVFWADAQMINDYGCFGDVVTFDTTYKINKDNRPLGVFVGVNNHKQMVVFGATLLYDETVPSFQWLFETFLQAMGGEKPKTILTDQDSAMATAISLVMPETFHGLCTWRIRENAMRHVDHLYQKGSQVCSDFEACIDLHEEEGEFLNAWNVLLAEHNVLKDSWLHSIFQLKEKWAWAYVRKKFTAGMRSIQLSESFNSELKNHLKSDLNLVQFFTHFERVVNKQRNIESEADYKSRHELPKLKMKRAPMLVQAGNIYTPTIFEEFQEEYEEYLGTCVKNLEEGLYVVTNYDNSKERMVIGNLVDQNVVCDCHKFETYGILCSHALKVLDVMNIKLIPHHYILKRWTRDARLGNNQDLKKKHIELDIKAHFMERYNELCPRMVKLIHKASKSHETYTFLSKVYEESDKTIDDMLTKKFVGGESLETRHASVSIGNEKIDNNVETVDVDGEKSIKKLRLFK